MSPRHLSKSKILSGLQCPKRLYLEIFQPELAQVGAQTERAFANGQLVGEVARTLWPGGHLVMHDQDLKAALAETARFLAQSPGSVALGLRRLGGGDFSPPPATTGSRVRALPARPLEVATARHDGPRSRTDGTSDGMTHLSVSSDGRDGGLAPSAATCRDSDRPSSSGFGIRRCWHLGVAQGLHEVRLGNHCGR